MAKKTPEERIAELDKKRADVEAKHKAEREAIVRAKRREQAKILNQKRKDDTRRKILIGAAMQQLVAQGRWHKDKLRNVMDGFLNKDQERELFDLPPKSE